MFKKSKRNFFWFCFNTVFFWAFYSYLFTQALWVINNSDQTWVGFALLLLLFFLLPINLLSVAANLVNWQKSHAILRKSGIKKFHPLTAWGYPPREVKKVVEDHFYIYTEFAREGHKVEAYNEGVKDAETLLLK